MGVWGYGSVGDASPTLPYPHTPIRFSERMTFSSPLALLLLAALPLLAWLGWPSRSPSRRREALSLGVRLLLALLLVLGLAGTELRRAADQLSVVYLVDHSDSMPAAARQVALDYVRQALQEMGPND